MARGLNRVFLIGTLTARPDMRYTPGGMAILDLNLAGQDTLLDASGQEREVPWYHRVRLLGRQAEMWGDILERGQLIFCRRPAGIPAVGAGRGEAERGPDPGGFH